MSAPALLSVYNRRCVDVADIPVHEAEKFASTLATSVAAGWRIISLFGVPEDSQTLRICAVVANDDRAQLLSLIHI